MITLTLVSPPLLTLFLSSTTSSSVSLFPIPLALSCRTLNVLSSLICLVGGAGDLVGGGDCWGLWCRAGVADPITFSPILRCILDSRAFRVHPSIAFGALVANSPTCDVASTYWTGILCSRAWDRMYIARHL